MIPKPKVLICLSGGADSVTALYEAVCELGPENVAVIIFDYKARHNSSEITFAQLHCHRLGVRSKTVELPPLGGLTKANWVVPWRNAILLSHAGNFADGIGANSIIIGCNKDDAQYPFPDCSKRFLAAMNEV